MEPEVEATWMKRSGTRRVKAASGQPESVLAHSPRAFSTSTCHVNGRAVDPEFDEIPPSSAGSSPLFPVVQSHSSTKPPVKFSGFCVGHSQAVVVERTTHEQLKFFHHFARRDAAGPFGDLMSLHSTLRAAYRLSMSASLPFT